MISSNIKYIFFANAVKGFTPDSIISKNLYGTNKKLYYERHQYLSYFLQKDIKHEIEVQNNIRKYIKSGDLIFDIGANIGQYTLLFSELAGVNGQVISFEPDPKSYAFLNFNININNCENVTPLNYGIGKNESVKNYFRDNKTGGRKGSFLTGFTDEKDQIQVSVESLDLMFKKYGTPDFIKIDVEGFESEIIQGLNKLNDNIIFLIEVRDTTKNFIFEYLTSNGYSCSRVDCKNEKYISSIEDIPQTADLLFKII